MKRINAILTLMLLLLPVLTGCGKKEEKLDLPTRLQDVSRLELARMTVGKVGMISDPKVSEAKDFLGKAQAALNKMKVGTRIGVYSYDTYLTAYVDLSDLREGDITVDEESGVVTVTLPPVQVMTDGREPQLHEEHYRVTGLRSSITPSERATLKAQMAREVKAQMDSDKEGNAMLRKAAEAKAKNWVAQLLENWGYQAVVTFRR